MFKFTEEQLMIRDMVREFTANEVEPRDRDMDENGFDFDLIPKLVDAGLMAIHLPEQYGGGGGALAAEGIGAGEQPPGLGTQLTGLPQAVHAGKRCLPGHGQAVEPEGFVGLGEKGTAGYAVGL